MARGRLYRRAPSVKRWREANNWRMEIGEWRSEIVEE
jgi:hypothetical protein